MNQDKKKAPGKQFILFPELFAPQRLALEAQSINSFTPNDPDDFPTAI